MLKGAYDKFIIRNLNIEEFTNIYDKILNECGFQIKEKTWDGYTARHKAIWGGKGTAFAISHLVPFGSWAEEGNRYCAEAEICQNGSDLVFKLLMVPYMSILDKQDSSIFDGPNSFLLTQGIIEKILDDDRCKAKLDYIINRFIECDIEITHCW